MSANPAPAARATSCCCRCRVEQAGCTRGRSAGGTNGTTDMSGAGTTTTAASTACSPATALSSARAASAGGTKRARSLAPITTTARSGRSGPARRTRGAGGAGPQGLGTPDLGGEVGRGRAGHGEHVQVDREAGVLQGGSQPRTQPLVGMLGALPVADGVTEDDEAGGSGCHVGSIPEPLSLNRPLRRSERPVTGQRCAAAGGRPPGSPP